MKKSTAVLLTPLFVMAAASCKQKEEWIYGGGRDTTVQGGHYRHYNGSWYPVYNNRIAPALFVGAAVSQIATPGYSPVRVSGRGWGRSGGFGHSASHAGGGG